MTLQVTYSYTVLQSNEGLKKALNKLIISIPLNPIVNGNSRKEIYKGRRTLSFRISFNSYYHI